MFVRKYRMIDAEKILLLTAKNKRLKRIVDELAAEISGFGGVERYKKFSRKEIEVIRYVLRRIDEEGATLEIAVNDAVDLYYRNTVLIFG